MVNIFDIDAVNDEIVAVSTPVDFNTLMGEIDSFILECDQVLSDCGGTK
jgi:hypothetical protein